MREPVDRQGAEVSVEEKVAFLERPEAYPDGPRRVETVETHMSWVFLADGEAYKLKKPVRHEFLDFSTVEARRRDCKEEIRLNRRLARDVYVGTVPLTVDARGKLCLGGKGTAVDWLVRMRRLDAERTLEHAIRIRAVREADVRAFAAVLGRFYRRARPVRIEPADYRRRFAGDVRANRRELLKPAFRLPRRAVEEVAAAQLAYLRRRPDRFDARVREGRVVEAHGDLRPEHVYLGPAPVVTDCLEFKREFRILDPADELAYLAMECERLGAPVVGTWVVDTYRRVTGDAPPDDLWQFYKCYRASLRAKIAIWHLKDPAVRDRSGWSRRAREYLRLAVGYAKGFAAEGGTREGSTRRRPGKGPA